MIATFSSSVTLQVLSRRVRREEEELDFRLLLLRRWLLARRGRLPINISEKTGRKIKSLPKGEVENEDQDELLPSDDEESLTYGGGYQDDGSDTDSDDDEEEEPVLKGKGKARAKASPKKRVSNMRIQDSDDENQAEPDIAEDSDEEERMLQTAIERSKSSSEAAVPLTEQEQRRATMLAAADRRLAAQASGSNPGYVIDDSQISSPSKSKSKLTSESKPKPKTSKSKAKPKPQHRDPDDSDGSNFAIPATPSSNGSQEDSDQDLIDDEENEADEVRKLQQEYNALSEKAKKFMTTEIRKKLQKLTKRINDIEQKTVRDKQAALKRQIAKREGKARKLTQGEKNKIALEEYHPELRTLWGDLEAEIPIIVPHQSPPPPGLKLQLLPFQKESLDWMKKQELGVWKGGMLAGEFRSRRTIQTIALFLSDATVHGKEKRNPSLVVAPVVALRQWKNEIEAHSEGLKVMIWHGTDKNKYDLKDLQKFHIILTSYGTLSSAYVKQTKGFQRKDQILKQDSLMHSFEWHRVVLDEAHNIKDRQTAVAKACFALECLSGTPLQNRVGELYSLVRFIGGDPYSYYFCKLCPCKSLHWSFKDHRHCDECGHGQMQHVCLWNNEILNPIQKYGTVSGEGKYAWKKMKLLLDRMMLRRTKLERADDLGLPPRTLVVRRDYFSAEEKELYLSLFTDAKRTFSNYLDAGTLLNNYSNIFTLITRMRQLACHPHLLTRSKTANLMPDIQDLPVCRLCNEFGEDIIISKCHHAFDRECISTYLQGYGSVKAPCPVCSASISIDLEGEAVDQDEEKLKKAKQGMLGRLDLSNFRSSTKVEALVEELSKLRNKDVTTKSLVFSQFVSFLDIIAFRLQRAGFKVCRLEGGMTVEARQATIERFMNSADVTVFLISLKAGGVALNLTEASRVFLMDRFVLPSLLSRIHRLGQRRPVVCTKLCIEDSIESKIIQLQEKKLAMTSSTLDSDASSMGKLTQEDLSFLFRL
ncbi:SNF2 family N-terminal domain-containing protein [Mrakia frigida]|uniref:DEAD/DEAH box helicase n=1 Tax=Mrakia frigida TaxID=29902 RepID=UPI003FCBFDF6